MRNSERKREWARAHHAAHRDDPEYRAAARERGRAWYQKNRERAIGNVRRYVAANRDKVLSNKRDYYARRYSADPEYRAQMAQAVNRRRARKAAAGPAHTLAEWRALVESCGGRCFYCHEAKPLTRDHKVPLVRGGSDAIENIAPACRSCNFRKGRKTADEFMALVAA